MVSIIQEYFLPFFNFIDRKDPILFVNESNPAFRRFAVVENLKLRD